MKKTIYIHIGGHKTGTTAIQQFLSMNRDNLKEKGYLYPGKNNDHLFIIHGLKNETWFYPNPGEITKKLFNEIHNAKCENIIISHEAFEKLNKRDISVLKNEYLDNISVKIIFYVRRQDDLVESRYNQNVKDRPWYSKEFSSFLLDYPKERLDHNVVLASWKEVFGKENIIVRCYEKEQLPKGIFYDFLQTVGLELNESYKIPKKTINKSLNWDLIEIIRLCNTQFKGDNNFNRYLRKNFAVINASKNSERRNLLSPHQRRDIIELFSDSNEKIAREYLGREDGKLFYAPLPNLNEPWEPYEGLTVEKIVPIFTRMLYNMDMQYQEQFQNSGIYELIKKKIWKKSNSFRNAFIRWKKGLFK